MRRLTLLSALFLTALGASSSTTYAATVQVWNTPSNLIESAKLTPPDLENGQLTTHVVLPDNYASRACWPVLYLLHGYGTPPNDPAQGEWVQSGHIDQLNLPAIVVIPGGGQHWFIDQWSGGTRQPAWESWTLREVLPHADQRLNICPQRSQHAIAGLSMGGYGAVYLASQRPDYFGSAASFSGVLAPQRPEWHSIFPRFQQLYGPPGTFYANAHDPVALTANLKSTRVLVETGDGNPIGTESVNASQRFQELEFGEMSQDFVKSARRAGVPVTFQRHAGGHTWENWRDDLQRMIAWNPFAPVTARPKRWTFSTAVAQGNAWGYTYKFAKPLTGITQFSMSKGVLKVLGSGKVRITTPSGRSVSSALPFKLHGRTVTRLRGQVAPTLGGPRGVALPVKLRVTAAKPGGNRPLTVSFRTTQALAAGKRYGIVVISTAPGCQHTVATYATQPAKGRLVTVKLLPTGDPAHARDTWCAGSAIVAAVTVDKGSTEFSLGQLLGHVSITFGGA